MIGYAHAIVSSFKYDNMLLHKSDSVLICYPQASYCSAYRPNTYILAYWRLKPLVRSCERIHSPAPMHARCPVTSAQ